MAQIPSIENHLREHRARRGWSQEELARRAGLSRAGISAIETYRLVPSAAAALALAEALECRVEDLFQLRRQVRVIPCGPGPRGENPAGTGPPRLRVWSGFIRPSRQRSG